MKIYQSYCRFCSDTRYPDTRYLKEEDGKITCTNCGSVLKIKPIKESPNLFALEVEKVGQTRL